jgi:eukaryotic-like serine/threonine-protein kinase
MKLIGKYQVVEELGGSPISKTYRVRDPFRHRQFALKILETVPGLTAEAKDQFCGHLASCAELTHRHIAKVHDLGEVEEGIFVATEWRSGTDLRQYMQANQDLPLGQRLAVIAQVAEGLALAHSRGIAHGDLKPSNIFVDGDRDVSILDFGIAKWLGALLEAGSRPEGLMANYLAPEQVLGQPFDARSDIFALGLMLYEFLTGKYPFSAAPGLIPREIVHSEPEPMRPLDAQISEELEQFVLRALKKDPEQRLQTAEEFAAGLYGAAQQIRRFAPTAAPTAQPAAPEQIVIEPPAMEPPVVAAAVAEPAVVEAAVIEAAVPAPPPAPLAAESAIPRPAPVESTQAPVRERPQDAEPTPQPWTQRSYAAHVQRPKETPASQPTPVETSRKSMAPPARSASYGAAPPPLAPQPQVRKQTAPSAARPWPELPPKASNFKKRALIAAAGLILAVGIVGSFLSRQNLRASQNKSHAVQAVSPQPSAPVTNAAKPQTVAVHETPVAKPLPPAAANDSDDPQVPAKQTLNGPVRSLWESGRYAEALGLVNQVLADDPSNPDARAWRKKIREAQAAEAALK